MFNRKSNVNGSKNVKKISKVTAFIGLFILLTLVFTMYQTSVNEVGSTVLDKLNMDADIISPITANQTAEAATTTTYTTTFTGDSAYAEQSMWGLNDEQTTRNPGGTVTLPSYLRKAVDSSTITVNVSTPVTTSRSKDDNGYCLTTVSIKISTTINGTQGSEAEYGYGENANSTVSGSYKLPTGVEKVHIRVELLAKADGQLGHDAKTTCACGTISVSFTSTDTTAPTISTDEGINWTSKNHFNLTDSHSDNTGVRSWSYNYTSPTGEAKSRSGNYDDETSKATSKSVNFQDSYGKYVITAKDNAGNSRSYTVYYYNPTVSVVANTSYGGSVTIGAGTAAGSSATVTNLSPSSNYQHTIRATTNDGYFFNGWEGTGMLTGSLTVGSYVGFSNGKATWGQSPTIPNAGKDYTSVPTSSSGTYTAKFLKISDYFDTGVLTATFDNKTHGIDSTTLNSNLKAVNDNYSATVNYVNKQDCVAGDYDSITQPTYAGTYTVKVTVKYGNDVIGYGEYDLVIAKRELKMVPTFTNYTKVYDGTTSTSALNFIGWTYENDFEYGPLCNGFNLKYNSADVTFAYENKNVGSSIKIVTSNWDNVVVSHNNNNENIAKSVTFALSSQEVRASITPKPLTLSATSADYDGVVSGYVRATPVSNVNGKVYDGNDSATINAITIDGTVGEEVITVDSSKPYTAKFNNINVGQNKSVTVSGIYLKAGAGADLSNYVVKVGSEEKYAPYSVNVSGLTIVAKEVGVTVTLAYNDLNKRIYDGTITAEIASATITGLVSGDSGKVVLQAGYYAQFDSKTAATGKTVTVKDLAITCSAGNDGAEHNYRLPPTAVTLTADIAPKPVTVTIACSGKVYDGGVVAAVTYTVQGKISSDTVNAEGSATYDNKNRGSRTVTATGITLTGSDSANYTTTNTQATVSGVEITPKPFEGAAHIGNIDTYTYDGNEHKPTPDVIDNVLGTLEADQFSYSYRTASIDYKNAGTYTVTVTAATYGNYSGTLSADYTIEKANCKVLNVQNITVVYGEGVTYARISAEVYNAFTYSDVPGAQNLRVAGTWEFVDAVTENGNTPYVSDSGNKYVSFTPSGNNYNKPDNEMLYLTVTKRPVTITAAEQGSVYGNDVVFDSSKYSIEAFDSANCTGLVSSKDTFGILTCTVNTTSDANTYEINGDYLSNDNYTVTYIGANYTITKRSITIKPIETEKIYGNDDPAAFNSDYYTVLGGLGNGKPLSGTLERTPGENVGTYVFTQGTVTNEMNTNYIIAFTPNVIFRINPRPVTIAPINAENFFGETIAVDQTAFTVQNVANRDILGLTEAADLNAKYVELFPVTIIRTEQGKTVAATSINAGEYSLVITSDSTASINSNYTATFVNGSYKIKPRPVLVTPGNNQGKTYGDADSPLIYTVTYGALPQENALTGNAVVSGYPLNGTLTREEGENVGSYQIFAGTLINNPKNANYAVSFTEINVYFTITKKTVRVIPDEVTISFNDPNPADSTLTFTTDPADEKANIIGGLRLPHVAYGEVTPAEVGSYPILADPNMLSSNSNYNIVVVGANKFTIAPLTAIISPVLATYTFGYVFVDGEGNLKDTIEFTATDKLKNTAIDLAEFTGKLAIAEAIPSDGILAAGNYLASKGTLSSENYIIELDTDVFAVSVQKLAVTLTVDGADKANSIYFAYGDTSAPIEFSVSDSTPLVTGHGLKITSRLSRTDSSNGNVGNYLITVGNLATENPDYAFTFAQEYRYIVAPRAITIVPHATSSSYGEKDVPIAYDTFSVANPTEEGLLGNDVLSGALSRKPGNDVDEYEIVIGSLNLISDRNSNPNYTVILSATPVYYTITRRNIEITARATSKIFGEAEPALIINYTSSWQLVAGDTLKGTLEREAGMNVGTYQINQGTVTNENNKNYNIIFKPGKFTIKQRPVSLTVNAATKLYGEADPAFSYQVRLGQNTTGTPWVEGADPTPYITISRVKGETVGSYNFNVNIDKTQEVVRNYNITSDTRTNKFIISKATTVIDFNDATAIDTADNLYKLVLEYNATEQHVSAYVKVGDASAIPSYRINGKIASGFTHAGEYIVLISVAETANYKGASVTVYVTVAPYDLGEIDVTAEIDADKLTKSYGQSDIKSAFTLEKNGLGTDTVSIELAREEGENAGAYDFVSATLKNSDYTASLSATAIDAYIITPASVDVVPETFSKVYGDADPELKQTVQGIGNETFVVEFVREAGANVGTYDFVSVSSLDANYAPAFATGKQEDVFSIAKKDATVTISDVTVTFDGTEHSNTLDYTSEGFVTGDVLVLTLSVQGYTDGTRPVTAGDYTIVAGDVAQEITANYNVTVVNGKYTINKAAVTVTPDEVTIEYGNPVPSFTYSVTVGTVFAGYALNGELGTLDVKNVGSYNIPQGTLTAENNPNYDITFTSDSKLEITKRSVTVTPAQTTNVVYGNTVNIAFTVTAGSLADGEQLLGALGATAYIYGTHAVTIGTLAQSNPNYDITLNAGSAVLDVAKRPIIVTADALSSQYGDTVKALTYTVTGVDGAIGLVGDDTLDGELTANIGANAGSYPVLQGTLGGDNYDITFVSAQYTVAKRTVTVTIGNQACDYGATITVDQNAYTISAGTVLQGDSLGLVLAKHPGNDMGEYQITATYDNENYDITFVNGIFTVRKFSATINVDELELSKVFDGSSISISAESSGSASLVYLIDGKPVDNEFTEAGRYYVEIVSPENDDYYKSESVFVTVVIRRSSISTEEGGIDVTIENEDGFDPDVVVDMKKLPQDDRNMNSVLSSNQTIVGAFAINTTGEGSLVNLAKQNVLRIKVPSALADESSVKVVVSDEEGNCSLNVYEVREGYITIEAHDVSGFAFVQESAGDFSILYYIFASIALLAVIAVIVFMFKKKI